MRPDGPRDTIAGPDVPEPPFPLKLGGKVIKGFGRGSKELGIPTANIPLAGLSVGGHEDLESGIYYGWAGLDFVSNDPSDSSVSPTTTNGINTTSTSNGGVGIASKVKSAVGSALFGSTTADESINSQGEEQQQQQQQQSSRKEVSQHSVHPMVMSVGWNPFYKNTVRSVEVHIMHDFAGRDFYGSRLHLAILGFIRPEYDYVSKESLIDDIRTDIEVAARSLERPAYAAVKADPFLADFPKDGEGRSLGDDVAS